MRFYQLTCLLLAALLPAGVQSKSSVHHSVRSLSVAAAPGPGPKPGGPPPPPPGGPRSGPGCSGSSALVQVFNSNDCGVAEHQSAAYSQVVQSGQCTPLGNSGSYEVTCAQPGNSNSAYELQYYSGPGMCSGSSSYQVFGQGEQCEPITVNGQTYSVEVNCGYLPPNCPTTQPPATTTPATTTPPDCVCCNNECAGSITFESATEMEWSLYVNIPSRQSTTYDNTVSITVPMPAAQCDTNGVSTGACQIEYLPTNPTPEFVDGPGFDSSVCDAWSTDAAGDYVSTCHLGTVQAGQPVDITVQTYYQTVNPDQSFSATEPTAVHFTETTSYATTPGGTPTVVPGAVHASKTDPYST